MSLSSILLAFALVIWSGLAEPSSDFETEILPIFQRHCLECHGNGNREGELNLETLAGVRVGGHSGNPLLAEELDQSELYLRVTSTSAGYRMPKKGEPLSAEELETLAEWIQATPPIATASAANTEANSEANSGQDSLEDAPPPEASAFPMLDALTPSQRYQAIAVLIAIALLLVYLVMRAVQTRNQKRTENPNHVRARTPLGWSVRFLFAAALCVAVVGFGYYYFLAARLGRQVDELTASVARLQPKPEVAKPIGPTNLPLPPSPMHPHRLGGRYYRGNDERDPSLFNGGFYRTATIDLRLIDAKNNPVQWEDDVSGDLFVEITIDRAPQATRELFSERVRDAVSLQHYNLADQIEGEIVQLEVTEAEQRWRAIVALPNVEDWDEGRTAGMIYIMYGMDHAVKSDTGAPAPRPHFGIRYEVEVDQGKITPVSTLWMGSMYTLGGRVLVPSKDQVLLDRWFDWRPIPAIEGEGSSDPKLLGVPEHVQNNQDGE